MKKILIADDHGLFRDGLKHLIKIRQPDAEVVEAADYPQLMTLLASERPDVLVMDLNMPGASNHEGVAKVCAAAGQTPVVVLSAMEDPALAQLCLRAGAATYLSKTCDSEVILDTLNNPWAPRRPCVSPQRDGNEPSPALTPQQRRLLELLVRGYSNKEIAGELSLSLGTVKQYVSALLRILEVDNRTQAALKGRRLLGENS